MRAGRILFTFPAIPPGGDLLDLDRPRGLPIGNQTRQFLANVVLHPLDHFICHTVKPEAACRYVDDLVLLDRDRGKLEAALPCIQLSWPPLPGRQVPGVRR